MRPRRVESRAVRCPVCRRVAILPAGSVTCSPECRREMECLRAQKRLICRSKAVEAEVVSAITQNQSESRE